MNDSAVSHRALAALLAVGLGSGLAVVEAVATADPAEARAAWTVSTTVAVNGRAAKRFPASAEVTRTGDAPPPAPAPADQTGTADIGTAVDPDPSPSETTSPPDPEPSPTQSDDDGATDGPATEPSATATP